MRDSGTRGTRGLAAIAAASMVQAIFAAACVPTDPPDGDAGAAAQEDAGSESECDIPEASTGCEGEVLQCVGVMTDLTSRLVGAQQALGVGCSTDDDCTVLEISPITCEAPALFLRQCPWAIREDQECEARQAISRITSQVCATCRPENDEACNVEGSCPPPGAVRCDEGRCVHDY
jgi:hypothetical protein